MEIESGRLLKTAEAAALCGLSPRTLEAHRFRGTGPVYVSLSPRCVRYELRDLTEWVASSRRLSTSAVAPPDLGL